MKRKIHPDQLVVAIDIGTTKICVLVAQPLPDGTLDVMGIGKSPSHGLAKGVVVDIGKTVHSIKTAVKEAELMAGCTIERATIGISGAHIQSRTSQGMITIKKREIRPSDIQQVLQSARAVDIAQGQQILHVLPQFYIIDGKEKILDPIGMYAVRLEAQVHIITGAVASVHNLIKCCESAGVQVEDIVLEQLASGNAVLTPDERQLGVAMLDIGGGTSDLAIYHNGAIRHTMVLPIAGNHFTNDIAIGLQAAIKEAERIKTMHGCVYRPLVMDEQFEIKLMDGLTSQSIHQAQLSVILEARAKEVLLYVYEEIERYQMRPFIPAGLVLTGGGSLLKGLPQLASSMMQLPVRIGHPYVQESLTPVLHNPMYATGYGLLLHALQKQDRSMNNFDGSMMVRVMGRMKTWVSDFF